MDAFNSVMKNYPDIKLLDAKYANWNRDDAFKVMQDYLTRFKKIDAVWAADDDMAVGVLKAIEQAKRNDIKIVFGGAGAKGMVKTLMDGKDPRIQANVTYSPKFIYDAIKLTAEARLKGEKLPATTIIPSVLITKDNAKELLLPRLAVLSSPPGCAHFVSLRLPPAGGNTSGPAEPVPRCFTNGARFAAHGMS